MEIFLDLIRVMHIFSAVVCTTCGILSFSNCHTKSIEQGSWKECEGSSFAHIMCKSIVNM